MGCKQQQQKNLREREELKSNSSDTLKKSQTAEAIKDPSDT